MLERALKEERAGTLREGKESISCRGRWVERVSARNIIRSNCFREDFIL